MLPKNVTPPPIAIGRGETDNPTPLYSTSRLRYKFWTVPRLFASFFFCYEEKQAKKMES